MYVGVKTVGAFAQRNQERIFFVVAKKRINHEWGVCTENDFDVGRRRTTKIKQGCQIFLGTKYQKGKKVYQTTMNYTKCP
jgi:hypothetical protein